MQKYHLHLSNIIRQRNKDKLNLENGVMGNKINVPNNNVV
jgi:hypothetical protein